MEQGVEQAVPLPHALNRRYTKFTTMSVVGGAGLEGDVTTPTLPGTCHVAVSQEAAR